MIKDNNEISVRSSREIVVKKSFKKGDEENACQD